MIPDDPHAWPINSRPGDRTMLDVPTDILTSFHYFSNIDIGAMRRWGTRIIGDSGAFSARSQGTPIDRETFHAWADRWRDDLFWTAALDVIGDPEATWQNWQAACRDGLALVPTLHYGADPREMDRYVEQGVDFFGLGGLVGFSMPKVMRWIVPVFQHAQAHYPHIRFHGWGISHMTILDRLPFWSADSSGFAAAFRFARLKLFDPRRGRFIGVDLDGRSAAEHARLLREHYNIGWKAVAVSTPETRREVGRVAIKAMQLYGEWLRSRQQVTPPTSLIAGAAGPRLPAVMAYPNTAQNLAIQPGPQAAVALGAPAMQPSKALDPEDSGPKVVVAPGAGADLRADRPEVEAVGPLPVFVTGIGNDPLIYSNPPMTFSELPKAGPHEVLAMGGAWGDNVRVINPEGTGAPEGGV